MSTERREGRDAWDVAIIGGGLSGLSCAYRLASGGHRVVVLEAADDVGGRARTIWHRGRPVDLGFQTLFRGYPRTRALVRAIGIPRRDLRALSGGVLLHRGESQVQVRRSTLGVLRLGGLSLGDRRRLVAMAADAARDPAACLEAPPTEADTTAAYLRDRGFGAEAIDGLFRPLFGSILLDPALETEPGYFRFLLGTMARGPALIPSDGLGMISEWTAAAVRQLGGSVLLGSEVAEIEADAARERVTGLRLRDGSRVEARMVVLATQSSSARTLLEGVDPATCARIPDRDASCVTAAFALSASLYSGSAIAIDCVPDPDPSRRVDLVCQTTNVTRPRSEEGPHILLAMRVTTGGASAEGLVGATERLIARWVPGFPFSRVAEHIGTFDQPEAQYRVLAGVRERLPGPRTALQNLILAGDMTRHPSIEGAVSGGEDAARVAAALLP